MGIYEHEGMDALQMFGPQDWMGMVRRALVQLAEEVVGGKSGGSGCNSRAPGLSHVQNALLRLQTHLALDTLSVVLILAE